MKPKKQRVERTLASGTKTQAEFNTFIKSALRALSLKWKPLTDCIKKARRGYGLYECAKCHSIGPPSLPPPPGKKDRIKNIIADHIEPIVDPAVGFTTWDEVIKRMFVEEDGFQALCHACHTEKTKAERAISDERRRKERGQLQGPSTV